MAQITLDIPAAQVNRVLDAIAANNGYTAADGTKAAFAKQWLVQMIKDQIRSYEAQQLITANNSDVDGNVVIT